MLNKFWIGARSVVLCAAFVAGTGVTGFAQDASSTTKPDNTKMNSKENRKSAVTADNSKNDKEDVKLTAAIRRAIHSDKQLSTYAKNIKIVVRSGTVTLTGPVRSEEEKKAVVAKATEAAGKASVNDQITVAPPKNSKSSS